jgi:glycosyltransferase involved in cell wall biosynthesis
MRLLFVADGRSPIAVNWIRYFVERGDEVFLASTFACQPDLKLNGLELVLVAFSGVKAAPGPDAAPKGGVWSASTLHLRTVIRQWLGPLTVYRASRRLRVLIEQVQPDLVHAMRIPYEGMLAADAAGLAPLLVSIWGNDLTLHAPSTPLMRHYTEWTLKVADALHADCQRDIRLAKQCGFPPARPTLVTPGNGGILADVFFPPERPVQAPVVVNPRGFRAYVRNDTFFQAIPLVLKVRPDALFLCASMAGEREALDWIQKLGIEKSVELLPPRPHEQMADLFRTAQVIVSPSTHDGTPNTLLEGMACGCFPVAGDLDSIREWITDGKNGLLVDPGDPAALAKAILRGLEDSALRSQAAEKNAAAIAERAEYVHNMARAAEFYARVSRKISPAVEVPVRE